MVISGNQLQSVAARGNQMSSAVNQWSSVVISGHQWSSAVISGHQWSSVVITFVGNEGSRAGSMLRPNSAPVQAPAEGCNQRPSEAIPRMKGKHLIEQRVRIDGLFQLNQHLDLP